jgi:hypothetical protein
MAEWVTLFDGKSLTGWHAVPRLPVPRAPGQPAVDTTTDHYRKSALTTGKWTVEDGAIIGRQEPPGSGFGGYLLSDGVYGDFELSIEVRPDWPADTGVLVRAHNDKGVRGFQMLLDHRKSGNIGGFYGNGIGGFHAINFNVDAAGYDAGGNATGIRIEDEATTLEPIGAEKPALLSHKATGDDFMAAWKWCEWNEMRLRVEGASPKLKTWINGTPIATLDTATMKHEFYDAAAVRALHGPRGHIALEVHDNDPRMEEARWGRTAACRWRNIRVREL